MEKNLTPTQQRVSLLNVSMGYLNNTECIKIRNKVIVYAQRGIITLLCAQVAFRACLQTRATVEAAHRRVFKVLLCAFSAGCPVVSAIEASSCQFDGGRGTFLKTKKEQSNWVSVSVSQAPLEKCVFKGFFFDLRVIYLHLSVLAEGLPVTPVTQQQHDLLHQLHGCFLKNPKCCSRKV